MKIHILQWVSLWNDAAEVLNLNQSIGKYVNIISAKFYSSKVRQSKIIEHLAQTESPKWPFWHVWHILLDTNAIGLKRTQTCWNN